MGIQRNIFAYTAPGADFPEYISINDRNGMVEITVRSPKMDRERVPDEALYSGVACMALSKDQAVDLARALLAHLSPAPKAEPAVIKPTVGRIVWYYENGDQRRASESPYAAQVAYVHSDSCVNLGYLDHNGVALSATSVRLVQDGATAPEWGAFCEWMPFQKGQAAKTKAVEMTALELGAAARAAGPTSY